MMLRLAVLSIALCFCFATASPAQVEENGTPDAPSMTRDEWKASIEAQKKRIQEMRREGRSFLPQLTVVDREQERSKLILEDYSLVFGDIVSTKQGLFRFVGKSGSDRKPEDFVPLDP